MAVLEGRWSPMSEALTCSCSWSACNSACAGVSYQRGTPVQGYLAHKKQPPSLEPSYGPRHSPTVGSWEGAVSCERGSPVRRMLFKNAGHVLERSGAARESRTGYEPSRLQPLPPAEQGYLILPEVGLPMERRLLGGKTSESSVISHNV